MDTVRLILVVVMIICAISDFVLALLFVRWTKANKEKTLGEVYSQLRSILTVFFALIICMVLLYVAFIAARFYI